MEPGFVPAEDLYAAGHGPHQARQPRYEDPLVELLEVDSFADRVPSSLYSREFLQDLDHATAEIPAVGPTDAADEILQGQRRHLEVLYYVEDCLFRNHPEYSL